MNSALIFSDAMMAILMGSLLVFTVAPKVFSWLVVKVLRPTNPLRLFEPKVLRWIRIVSAIGLAYGATILLMTIFYVGHDGHAHE